jgi:4-diphosphocytidyl-2-C-methyl-D-erythritol kinase
MAAALGSDVPFFLQGKPALATGRGEKIAPLEIFPAFREAFILLIHPGFGISTAWAYRALATHPDGLNGRAGRAQKLVSLLHSGDLEGAATEFYNSLEAPALKKYPLLVLIGDFLKANGAVAALMSGSGSTTFALVKGRNAGEHLQDVFKARFGDTYWMPLLAL